jgi:hypothetical protein
VHPDPCGRTDEIATADMVLAPDGTVVLDCYDKRLDSTGFDNHSTAGTRSAAPARCLTSTTWPPTS